MVIIKELDNEGDASEPSNSSEPTKLYEFFMNNVRWVDGTIDYNLLEI